MVYKLKPLELSFDFEDRIYELGDTIDIQLSLAPNGDIDVREGRVHLVCDEVHAKASRGIAMGVGGSAVMQGGNIHTTTDLVPMSSSQSQRTESYVHSSVAFLEETTLRSGRPGTYRARLQIQPSPPKHLDEARDLQRDSNASLSFRWRLVASVNVVRGRDPKRQRKINVRLPIAPIGQGARPKMSTPKKSTGPSA